MKIKQPEPFTFEAGERAVLLLHGFTGHTADVRMLGRFLEKKGYTSHAPIYRGHGLPPEELIKAHPDEWWEDVEEAFNHLQDLGYKEIAVCGLSLGGVLSLKLAYSEKVKAVLPMSTPMFFDNRTQLTHGFEKFATEYKQLQEEPTETIDQEVKALLDDAKPLFHQLGKLINEVKTHVDTIYTPAFVVQPRNDELINIDSASYIYNNIQSDHKEMKWYEESGHVITLGEEREKLHDDIYTFLESLDWES